MKAEKPSIPKGTRDFSPEKMLKRNFIFNTIRKVFEKCGYQPLETPAVENLSVLTGKYGDEGDQLLFKILNSGDFLSKTRGDDVEKGYKHLTKKIAEKGLRYDLTVPFARYVVMNRNDITFPFKRYQIQPVWRADKPQKGRYREFYQCDADVVGTNSLVCEAEIIQMINEVFGDLGITDFTIKLNNRKLLMAITELIGAEGKETAFCVAIDKLDKIGRKKVEEEMLQNGFSEEAIKKMDPLFSLSGDNTNKINQIKAMLSESPAGLEGVHELEELFKFLDAFNIDDPHIDIDITLARGLSYYTGTIIEVKVNNATLTSSVSGGGRYDNLTGVFGMEGVSGVGISFGVDRIYDVMEDLDLFPKDHVLSTKVLLIPFDNESMLKALSILSELRSHNIFAEVFPDITKLKKPMNYANKKDIPFVILIGSEELKAEKYGLKDMNSGVQEQLSLPSIIDKLQ